MACYIDGDVGNIWKNQELVTAKNIWWNAAVDVMKLKWIEVQYYSLELVAVNLQR